MSCGTGFKTGQNSCTYFSQASSLTGSPICECGENASVVKRACACNTGFSELSGQCTAIAQQPLGGPCTIDAGCVSGTTCDAVKHTCVNPVGRACTAQNQCGGYSGCFGTGVGTCSNYVPGGFCYGSCPGSSCLLPTGSAYGSCYRAPDGSFCQSGNECLSGQ